MRKLFAETALLPDHWANNVEISINEHGLINDVQRDVATPSSEAETVTGALIPGMPNCHSHAFQRAIVGLTETRSGNSDSFWSWREVMYRYLRKIGPDDLEIIAEQLYIEMLKHGYTGVAEFHYLHHDINGAAYDDPVEMSRRLISAAQRAGIHMTMLPVLYAYSDFGARPPAPEQGRFIHSLDAYQHLLQTLHRDYADQIQLGIAPHSLRAVDKPLLREAINVLDHIDPRAPIHIHIAEQTREVEASVAHSGARPVEWLLNHFDVNPRWCLVHATHLSESERKELATTGAIAGLCPTTEANLGDGLFPAAEFLQEGGRVAIGSDSQVCVNPAEELRLLEYGQRLFHRGRAILADEQQPSVGENLFRRVCQGGAQALGIHSGVIATGARADLVVLDRQQSSLCGKSDSALLDGWVFGSSGSPLKDVMVGGEWKIRDGRAPQQEELTREFCAIIRKLAG